MKLVSIHPFAVCNTLLIPYSHYLLDEQPYILGVPAFQRQAIHTFEPKQLYMQLNCHVSTYCKLCIANDS